MTALPDPTSRMNPHRKVQIVLSLINGTWTAQELCDKYAMSREELDHWVRSFNLYGRDGLSVTRMQDYREGASHLRE